ncbi:proline-specific peptidase [Moniliophthora roreri MCA 2997]|uniref:Proline-specific peptidase n=1 Tax=Moniliophthora roreri (strain MCA 2997) TaxID=1381753 RepID=V2XX07_MONRO|nr:proline-specific peptidase [Moniliophthora roreri MCA 2997]
MASLGDNVKAGMGVDFSDPVEYRAALEKSRAVNGCTVGPVPKEITFNALDQIFGDKETGEVGDPIVLINMFGGAVSGWSIEDRLDVVSVPTFVISGRKEDFVCEAYFWKVKRRSGSHLRILATSPHVGGERSTGCYS